MIVKGGSLALALSLGFASGPVAALTCLPASVERAFGAAHDAQEVYVPVLGRFTGFAQRSDTGATSGRDRRFRARFRGHVVTRSGPGRALEATVSVAELCLGPWCPAFPPDVPVLTFLQRAGPGYRLEVDACHGTYFAEPGVEQIETLRNCLKTMACGDG